MNVHAVVEEMDPSINPAVKAKTSHYKCRQLYVFRKFELLDRFEIRVYLLDLKRLDKDYGRSVTM